MKRLLQRPAPLIMLLLALAIMPSARPAVVKQGDTAQIYSNLNDLTLASRREVFRGISNEQRSGLWRHQLRLALQRPLNTAQREIVERVIALATPDYFAQHQGDAVLDVDIHNSFTGDDAREIFAQLGGPEVITRRHHAAKACECSQESDYCALDCTGNGCSLSSYGCGTLWVYACNGLCRSV